MNFCHEIMDTGRVDTDNIGVSGHSQGGGAALKAGDGIFEDGTMVSTVVAMNPYGPSFVKSMEQNGQILLLGGTDDGVTPTDSFSKVLENNVFVYNNLLYHYNILNQT